MIPVEQCRLLLVLSPRLRGGTVEERVLSGAVACVAGTRVLEEHVCSFLSVRRCTDDARFL